MKKNETSSEAGPVLVCLDGSPDADAAADLALAYARNQNKPLIAAHVYDARIHESRFRQMEPGLPKQYQIEEGLRELRDSHGTLMSDGFQALSRGYLKGFMDKARNTAVEVQMVVEEGRNYVGLLKAAERFRPCLVAMGAGGLGDPGDGQLGSTAVRLMRRLSCDILVGRAHSPASGPVLTGIDGSGDALIALDRARIFARTLKTPLHLLAAYDPQLHQRVFKAMADTMPPEAQAAVGLDKQQELHESLIDDGLGALYRQFLDEAAAAISDPGFGVKTHLVADKGYRGIVGTAVDVSAGLICLGRFGHNREAESDIGATAENTLRTAPCSVLVTAPPEPGASQNRHDEEELAWDAEALQRLEKVPRFVRRMARRSIEAVACSEGADRVTVKHFEMVSEKFRGKK